MVSIIIPIYNVKQYIDRGLRSVFSQTYQNFEIILSDDGSTDGSYEECLRWANTDSRVRVVRHENGGAGVARNYGLELAMGEFVYFFDIDDEINKCLLQYCVHKMNEVECDFICFGYENVETTYTSKTIVTFPETIIHSNDELKSLFVEQFVLKVNGFPWNKFFRKSFLDKYQLQFESQRIQQDEVFNLKCYQHLERAYLSPEVMYTYYIYERGNTRSRFIPDRFEIYQSVRSHFEDIKSFWHLHDSRFDNYLKKRFYSSVLQCLLFNLNHPNCIWSKNEKKAEIKRIMSDELTQEAFRYARTECNDFENKVYQYACRNQNLWLIEVSASLFARLHRLMKRLHSFV